MGYTDLIFDLYGTLVDTRTEEGADTWERTAIFYGFYGAHYTGKELQEAFEKSMRQREASAGQSYECFPDVPCEITFAQLFRDKGVSEDADALGFRAAQVFRMISMQYLRLYPGVMEALAVLRQKGCRLWLLSNAQRVFTAYELRHLGLEDQFDKIYISSDYGCRKPDSRFFQTLLEEQKLDPANCLMIGNDRRSDIAGARKVGIDTLYLHANITPADQAPADPALHPGILQNAHHYEIEGTDWHAIVKILPGL